MAKQPKNIRRFNRVLAGLDERNKRRFVGLLASQQENISLLSEITGVKPKYSLSWTNGSGTPKQDFDFRCAALWRRQNSSEKNSWDPEELEAILQDAAAGDPISGLKWTRKTTRALAEELKKKEIRSWHSTIPRLAKKLGYTLKKNRKRLSRKQDEKRDEQMKYLTRQRKRFLGKNSLSSAWTARKRS